MVEGKRTCQVHGDRLRSLVREQGQPGHPDVRHREVCRGNAVRLLQHSLIYLFILLKALFDPLLSCRDEKIDTTLICVLCEEMIVLA